MTQSNDAIDAVKRAYRLVYAYQRSIIQIIQKLERDLELNFWYWEGPSGSSLSRRDSNPISKPGNPLNLLPLAYSYMCYVNACRSIDDPVQAGDYCVLISHFSDSVFLDKKGCVIENIDHNALEKEGYEQYEPLLAVNLIVIKSIEGETTWNEIRKLAGNDGDWSPWYDYPYYEIAGDLEEPEDYKRYFDLRGGAGVYKSKPDAFSYELTGETGADEVKLDLYLTATPVAKLMDSDAINELAGRLSDNLKEMRKNRNKNNNAKSRRRRSSPDIA